MVKPSINPEGAKKDAINKEAKGKEAYLPAFAVIPLGTELPPKFDETPIPVVNRPRKLGVCFCVTATLFVLIAIIGLALALFFNTGKFQFRCGVQYDDDYPDKYFQDGDYMYDAPDKTLEEEVEIDPFKGYERIEIPEQDYCEKLTILHDFTVNMTAYRLHRSQVCYITWLDNDIVMGPDEFVEKAEENPEFLTEHYETVYKTYRVVLPELFSVDYGFGYYIPLLCNDVESYWIEKIPADELEAWEQYWADQYPEEAEGGLIDDGGVIPPAPEHRFRRDAESKEGVDKIRMFVGKLVQAKIFKPEIVKAKAALEKIAS